MNIKKIQGRIPMNIKKIIPISLAAMSVMGSFTACSDNKVVGADEQTHSVAVHLEEKEIASKTATLLKESSKPNVATTVIVSRKLNEGGIQEIASTQVLEGDDAYNRAMNDIIAVDTLNTSYETAEGWRHYEYSGTEF